MKAHDFFVGIDSDGTAFDSMNYKHKKAFIPAAFRAWDLESYRDEFITIWENINLTSETRGINRFLGLLTILEKLSSKGYELPDYSVFQQFCKSQPLSNAGLKKFIEINDDKFLAEVFAWSKYSDELFDKEVENLPPFDYVKDALELMSRDADIMVVSSASLAGIKKDWTRTGLMQYVTTAAGQESGTKNQQLKTGAEGKYAPDKILMIGDAPGDREAAKATNALFYPIIPSREVKSWKRLIDVYFCKFLDGSYKDIECELIDEFNASLQSER